MIDARDTALIIEGGGMRNSYTAPAIVKLIEQKVQFGWVGGVSAGSTHTLSFASRDTERAKWAFTDLATHPEFGGWRSFVRGTGLLNSDFIYEGSAQVRPLDFDTFASTTEEIHIEATRADTGETVVWNRADLAEVDSITLAVRASSTLPVIMPITLIDGVPYVDGALGSSGGLLIDAAQRAGYEKFLVLATRPRDYTKPVPSRPGVIKRVFRRHPAVAEAVLGRPELYNAAKQTMLDLEQAGQAYIFFPENMMVESTERNVAKLNANYAAGEEQVEREWPQWREFLA
ncbi:patatin family protein [Corynebacterium qintianiae]|uniref:patatin-like phospholipase family protein n=1 Tax=Corynebacterium qintianiae TaxID=2709392 RepID=UPI0013EA91E5|nr:patatin family protein [Corynebacterium qintianiae]